MKNICLEVFFEQRLICHQLKPNSCTYPFSKKGSHHFFYFSVALHCLTDDVTDIQMLRATERSRTPFEYCKQELLNTPM